MRTSRIVPALLCLGLILGLGSPTFLDAQTADDLRRANIEWRQAYDAKKWDEAKELSRRLMELQPNNPVHPYNMACVLALAGEKESAVQYLTRSSEMGFAQAELCASDPDLASIRETDGFRSSLNRVRENAAKQAAEFERRLATAPIQVTLPPQYDRVESAPVIFALHPFGGTPEWITRQWKEVAAEFGAIVIAPQAVRPQGRGFQWGPPVDAEAQFLRAYKLLDGLKADKNRVVVTGFSQGAWLAFHLGMKHCEKFQGVIPVAGQYDPQYARPSGSSAKPKFVILVGDQDRVIESNRTAARVYKEAGISCHLEVYEGLGHAFPPNPGKELIKALGRIWK